MAANLIVFAAFATLIGLGTWQIERRAWKLDVIATMETRLAQPPRPLSELIASAGGDWGTLDYRPARVTGRFAHDREMYLAARSYQGRIGYHVVTPLITDFGGGASAVLVDRGWVSHETQSPASRPAGQVPGEVTIAGILRRPSPAALFTPDNQPDRNHWYWVDIAAMARHAGLVAPPILLEAGPAENPGGLPIGGLTRVTLTNNHLSYALTWYGLAAALAVIYLVSRRRAAGASPHSSP